MIKICRRHLRLIYPLGGDKIPARRQDGSSHVMECEMSAMGMMRANSSYLIIKNKSIQLIYLRIKRLKLGLHMQPGVKKQKGQSLAIHAFI